MQGFMINRCINKRRINPSTQVVVQKRMVKRGINPSTLVVGVQKKRAKRGINLSTRASSPKKMVKKNVHDTFSELPNEVLVTILSLLPMNEAARTSVLSRRWYKLWTSIPNLNFDAPVVLSSMICLKEHLRIKARQKYIDWVKSVLNSYQETTTIQEFRVRFDLNADYTSDIDTWVKFAFERKVKSFTMHFPVYCIFFRFRNHYPFPALCNSTKQLFSDYISLRKLDLEYVDISGDFIHHFISSCPLLEELAIVASDSQHLVHINVDGPSLCLRHLKIVSCSYVKSIYLSAPILSSFEYEGDEIDINYANTPNLVDVSLGGKYFCYIIFNFPRLSNYVMRLETLALHVRGGCIKPDMMLVEFPELPELRNLKLDIYGNKNESILFFASLIKAAPSLHKLEFKFSLCDELSRNREVEKISKRPHKCLKEVEVLGFAGETIDMELIMYVLENAIALERVTLDHVSPLEEAYGLVSSLKHREFALKQAKRLKSEFSLGQKLIIL